MTTLAHIVGTTIKIQARQQAQLPYDAGGLGLMHPDDMRALATLSMLLNVGGSVLKMGNESRQIEHNIGQAVRSFTIQRG